MTYNQESDTYICHAGKELRVIYLKKQRSKSGYESEVTVYECEDCTGCPYKEKCTKAKGNKRMYVSKSFWRSVRNHIETFRARRELSTGRIARSR